MNSTKLTAIIAILVILVGGIAAAPYSEAAEEQGIEIVAGDVYAHIYEDSIDMDANTSTLLHISFFNESANPVSVKIDAVSEDTSNVDLSYITDPFYIDAGNFTSSDITVHSDKYAHQGTYYVSIVMKVVDLSTGAVAEASGKIEVNVSSTFSSGDQFNKILGFIPNPLGEPFDTPYVNAAISLIIFLFVGIVLAIIFKMLLSKNMDKLYKLSLSKADIRYLNLSVFLIFLLFGVTNALKVAGVNEELVATAMSITSITVCCIASITVWEFYKLAIYHIVNKSDKIEQSLIPLFLMIGKIVIAVLAVSSIMTALGINFAAIVASAGIVTLGISLGAQSTLNQFFCGLVLLATRPFRVGDKIKLGTDGDVLIVRKISVMDTLFKNWVNEEVYRIPNSAVMESTIVNITSDDITYKVYEYFDVAYGSDIDLARQIILNTVSAHPKVIQDGSKDGPSFRFNSMESSSVRLRVTYVVTDHEIAGTVASQIREAVYRKFRAEGIEIPYNVVDVHEAR